MLVFEDLHWADDGLLDFVDHLVDWASGVPLLVVCTARPGAARAPAGLGRRQAERLDDLARAAVATRRRRSSSTALLEQAGPAGRDAAGAARAGRRQPALRRGVRAAARRARLGRGPAAARDGAGAHRGAPRRLSPEEKALLQDAAVSARSSGSARSAIGGRALRRGALHALERKEFVRRERRSSVAGEDEYAFRHVLVRDVAYGQIPRAARGREAPCARPSGSSRSAAPTTTPSSSRTTSRPRPSSASRSATAHGSRIGAPATVTARSAHRHTAKRYYAQALESWPVEDAEYPLLVAAFALPRSRHRRHGALDAALDALEAAGLWEEAAQLAATAAMTVWYASRRSPPAPRARVEAARRRDPPHPGARGAARRERAHPLVPRRARARPAGARHGGGAGCRPGSNELRASLLTTQGSFAMDDGHSR